jgi:hypothetical protein
LNDEIKNHQNLDKKAKEKLEIKRTSTKLKNIIYEKLELMTKLKIKKVLQKDQGKKSEIKTLRTKLKKIKYLKLELKD